MNLNPERWNMYHIALLLFSLEHAMFGLNVLIEVFIPDVPADVKDTNDARAKNAIQARIDMNTYKVNRGLSSLQDYVKELKDVSQKVSKREQYLKRRELKEERAQSQAAQSRVASRESAVDGNQNAREMRNKLKKQKYDLAELQRIAIDRQKLLNKFNKEKKRYKRTREKQIFKQVMASRLDNNDDNDISFNSDSSIESEHDDIRFLNYRKQMQDLYAKSKADGRHITSMIGQTNIVLSNRLATDGPLRDMGGDDSQKKSLLEGERFPIDQKSDPGKVEEIELEDIDKIKGVASAQPAEGSIDI